jgi:hypothetical protein
MNPIQLSNTLYGMVHTTQSLDSVINTINNNFSHALRTEQDVFNCLRDMHQSITVIAEAMVPMLELAEHVMKNHPQVASDFATSKRAAVKILGGNNGGG